MNLLTATAKFKKILRDIFSNSTCFLALGTDFISFANRWCCEDISELVQLLLNVTALFTGNGILFTRPKGDDNAFASFAVDEEITSTRALLPTPIKPKEPYFKPSEEERNAFMAVAILSYRGNER